MLTIESIKINKSQIDKIRENFVEQELNEIKIVDCLEFHEFQELQLIFKELSKYIEPGGFMSLVFTEKLLLLKSYAQEKSQKAQEKLDEMIKNPDIVALYDYELIIITLENLGFVVDTIYFTEFKCCLRVKKNVEN